MKHSSWGRCANYVGVNFDLILMIYAKDKCVYAVPAHNIETPHHILIREYDSAEEAKDFIRQANMVNFSGEAD